MNGYIYTIKVDSSCVENLAMLEKNVYESGSNENPLFFTSENNNLYCILHGIKEGYLSVGYGAYTAKALCRFYKSFAMMTNHYTLNLISCYGKNINKYESYPFTIKSAIRSSNIVYVGFNVNTECVEIITKNKITIPNDLKCDIKFGGKFSSDEEEEAE